MNFSSIAMGNFPRWRQGCGLLISALSRFRFAARGGYNASIPDVRRAGAHDTP